MQKQLFTKSMPHSNLSRDNYLLLLLLLLLLICYPCPSLLSLLLLVKRMFSSIWLIWKVVAIRFSHCKQCLIVTSFDIVPSAPLNQVFCFYWYLNIKKVVLLLNTNNLYKLQTLFLIKAILPLICWRVFLSDPHIHLTSIIS